MMEEIRYVLMDPAGNKTILCETPVSEEGQPAVAGQLMRLEPDAEQVGFVTWDELPGTHVSLRMAGGEFCGNASMSVAVLYCMQKGLDGGRILVSASGAPEPVEVEVTAGLPDSVDVKDSAKPDRIWTGTVTMPRPESIQMISFPDSQLLPVVSFAGISHVILDNSMPVEELAAREAERLAKEWCKYLQADALGLLFLDKTDLIRGEASLKPLVYVPAADTLFWESACGSGTAAVGAWLAKESGRQVDIKLHQPGGTLEIAVSPAGNLLLKGTVKCLHEKTCRVELE